MNTIIIQNNENKIYLPHKFETRKQEIRGIRNYVRRNPRITLCELWENLKREKGQIDVEYVPKAKDLPKDKRFYQYTYIEVAYTQRKKERR